MKTAHHRKEGRALLVGLAFASPWIIGFFVFTLYPICSSLYYSFTDFSILKEPVFVGLDNYIKMFTNDRLFLISMKNTGYMIVIGLPIILVLTFTVSVILNDKRLRGTSVIRTLFFMPTLVPAVVLCILWMWMLQPETGVINGFLDTLGIRGPAWLASPSWSKPGIILMQLWCSGNMIIIFLAGLQGIPRGLYEAAEIDGANFIHKFWYIMIPHMLPIITYNLITGMIRMLQQFTEAFIMTNGGPNDSTTFFGYYLYINAFKYLKMGYASAMAWVMLVIALLLTIAMLRAMHFGKETDG